MVARIAAELVDRVRSLTESERALEQEITHLVASLAPNLLELVGVGPLTAAKIVGEVADIRRFKSKDAFARHNGTAPQPAWSGNSNNHCLSRNGNRQLNAAIHQSPLPSSATTSKPRPTGNAELPRATPRVERSAPSSDAFLTWSTGPFLPMHPPPPPC